MKILVVHNYYRISGGEDSVVANETALLRRMGHDVTLYFRSNNEYADLKGSARLKKLALPFITVFNPKTYRDIRKIIRDKKIDIVHVHNTLNLISPSVYYAAKSLKIPVVQTVHNYRLICPGAALYRDKGICEDCLKGSLKCDFNAGSKDSFKGGLKCDFNVGTNGRFRGGYKGSLTCALKYKCYRGSFLETLCCVILLKIHRGLGIYKKINYICLTEFNKNKLLSSGVEFGKIFVKPNFANAEDELKSERLKRESSAGSTLEYFVYAGRLDELKGVDFLLKSWSEDMPELLMCGTGPLSKWCSDYIRDNRIKNVVLKGVVEHKEVMELLRGAKGVILPTRWYEGFPMIIAESYSVGTPVIATNLGNAGDLVKEGVTGYKFEDGDAQGLRRAVRKVCEAYTQAQEGLCNNAPDLRKTIIEYFNEHYGPQKNYEELMEIYECCIKSGTKAVTIHNHF